MERIVVGVDGSPCSLAALRWAATEARSRGARLDVVMAWEYGLPVSGTLPTADEMDHRCRAELDQVMASEGLEDSGIEVHTKVVRGPAGPALVNEVGKATQLVLGSEGHGAFEGKLVGSVSMYCTAKAPCPVVVIPPDDR